MGSTPNAAPSILIAAGGTGGHLFPGIAVADELRRRNERTRVVFVGSTRGLETRLIPSSGYALETLPILPLNRVGLIPLARGLLALPLGLTRAASLVARLRPQAVLGIGGYAGGPVVFAAALMGVPTMILEPNALPGFTNRLLGPFVRVAACAHEGARQRFGRKGVVTGNPVRPGFLSLPPKDHRAPLTLLAFGGSQGSRILNAALLAAVPLLPGPEALRIVHQTGPAMLEEVEGSYAALGRPAETRAFLDPIEACFGEADLILSRSGATTCAEVNAAGKAAILVPLASAAGGHQKLNAHALEQAGAARMIEEQDLSGRSLAATILEIVSHPERISAMETASRALGRPDASARVAELLLGLLPHGDAGGEKG